MEVLDQLVDKGFVELRVERVSGDLGSSGSRGSVQVRSWSQLLGGLQDVLGFDELGSGCGGGGQSVVGEGVDSAHDSLGGLEEGLVGGGGEEGPFEAGDLEAVLEVAAGGVSSKPRSAKRMVILWASASRCDRRRICRSPDWPVRRTASRPGAVPFKVGEQGKQGEDVGSEVVGFVDDEQDGEVAILDESLDLVLDEAEGHGPGPLGLAARARGRAVGRSRLG